ncbi:MAG: hypothetical protein ACK4NC_05780 [Candidatus Gracilibacteria bacterium]
MFYYAIYDNKEREVMCGTVSDVQLTQKKSEKCKEYGLADIIIVTFSGGDKVFILDTNHACIGRGSSLDAKFGPVSYQDIQSFLWLVVKTEIRLKNINIKIDRDEILEGTLVLKSLLARII